MLAADPLPLAAPSLCRLAGPAFQVFMALTKQPSLQAAGFWLFSLSGWDLNSNFPLVPSNRPHFPCLLVEDRDIVEDRGEDLGVGVRSLQILLPTCYVTGHVNSFLSFL